jgi:hydrogenase small subunit
MAEDTVYQRMRAAGISRRDFMKACGLLAATMGMTQIPVVEAGGLSRNDPDVRRRGSEEAAKIVARALQTKPASLAPVIWLELQDCAGCTESITRSHAPTLVNLVLNSIALNYQETLFAAAGYQAESAKQEAMKKYAGKYVLVVEGSIPADGTGFCTVGGRSALDLLQEAASGAAAVIATGNCATFGGLPKAKPNPTGAKGVWEIIKDKPVINIPGCPAIPDVFSGTIAHYLIFGTVPALDALHRPVAFYGRLIHDRCLRRSFYEAGKFAGSFDDEGARNGYCLYKLGCKGPTTYNDCATMKWDAGLSFPIQSGHPCLGCSQPDFWDGGGFYQGQSAPTERPAVGFAAAAAGIGLAAGVGIAVANRGQKRAVAGEEPEPPAGKEA